MHGMVCRIRGDKLLIEVDISEDAIARAPLSNTGKTCLVATTGASMPIISPYTSSLRLRLHMTRKPRNDGLLPLDVAMAEAASTRTGTRKRGRKKKNNGTHDHDQEEHQAHE